jgi:hypothetical protein
MTQNVHWGCPRCTADRDERVCDEAEKHNSAERAEVFLLTTSTYGWSPPVMVRLEAIGITQLREVSRTSQH